MSVIKMPYFKPPTIKLASRICNIYTSRINYIALPDQLVLNTTIKSGDGIGKIFAPTWDMVMGSKDGSLSWDEYTHKYITLMEARHNKDADEFVQALSSPSLVLCCYCADTHDTTRHCHRYLLADILVEYAPRHGITARYRGEVYNPPKSKKSAIDKTVKLL